MDTPKNKDEAILLKSLQGMADSLGKHHPAGAAAATLHRYVLANGKFYKPAKLPSKYRRGTIKFCYGNSLHRVRSHPELTYVEGFAYTGPGFPAFDHAWCVTEDGTVVDTTLPKVGVAYFGVAFDRETVLRHLERGNRNSRPRIMGPDFFDPDVEWKGGNWYGRRSQGSGESR